MDLNSVKDDGKIFDTLVVIIHFSFFFSVAREEKRGEGRELKKGFLQDDIRLWFQRERE